MRCCRTLGETPLWCLSRQLSRGTPTQCVLSACRCPTAVRSRPCMASFPGIKLPAHTKGRLLHPPHIEPTRPARTVTSESVLQNGQRHGPRVSDYRGDRWSELASPLLRSSLVPRSRLRRLTPAPLTLLLSALHRMKTHRLSSHSVCTAHATRSDLVFVGGFALLLRSFLLLFLLGVLLLVLDFELGSEFSTLFDL